jgi:hypothetical protein
MPTSQEPMMKTPAKDTEEEEAAEEITTGQAEAEEEADHTHHITTTTNPHTTLQLNQNHLQRLNYQHHR